MQWSVGYPLVPFQMPRLNLNLKMVEWNSALSVAQGLKTNFSTKYMSYDPNKRMIQENFSSMDPRKTVRITLSLGPYHFFLYFYRTKSLFLWACRSELLFLCGTELLVVSVGIVLENTENKNQSIISSLQSLTKFMIFI